jgi:hypothetical protein
VASPREQSAGGRWEIARNGEGAARGSYARGAPKRLARRPSSWRGDGSAGTSGAVSTSTTRTV